MFRPELVHLDQHEQAMRAANLAFGHVPAMVAVAKPPRKPMKIIRIRPVVTTAPPTSSIVDVPGCICGGAVGRFDRGA